MHVFGPVLAGHPLSYSQVTEYYTIFFWNSFVLIVSFDLTFECLVLVYIAGMNYVVQMIMLALFAELAGSQSAAGIGFDSFAGLAGSAAGIGVDSFSGLAGSAAGIGVDSFAELPGSAAGIGFDSFAGLAGSAAGIGVDSFAAWVGWLCCWYWG